MIRTAITGGRADSLPYAHDGHGLLARALHCLWAACHGGKASRGPGHLSPAQLDDIGIAPHHLVQGPVIEVDAGTMTRLMSMR